MKERNGIAWEGGHLKNSCLLEGGSRIRQMNKKERKIIEKTFGAFVEEEKEEEKGLERQSLGAL